MEAIAHSDVGVKWLGRNGGAVVGFVHPAAPATAARRTIYARRHGSGRVARCRAPERLRVCAALRTRGVRGVKCAVEPPARAATTKRSAGDGRHVDPVEVRVRAELAEQGVPFEQLINPARVLKLERRVAAYRAQLAAYVDADAGAEQRAFSPEQQRLLRDVTKAERELVAEKRAVMRQWLKNVFVVQAALTAAVGGYLAFDPLRGTPLYLRALGFWMIWLFSIPSLRARKPRAEEKSALNVAFLVAPLVNMLAPSVSKEPGYIWAAQVLLLAACYGYYGAVGGAHAAQEHSDQGGETRRGARSQWNIRGALRWLDWGSWR